MKNSVLLDKNFKEFVKNNSGKDPNRLRLALTGKETGFPAEFAVTQIECRQRCSRKLARFLANEDFLFPSVLAGEQATHQCVAAYHSILAGNARKIIDITAGLGIDAMTFAMDGHEVTALEMDPERAEVLDQNCDTLQLENIKVEQGDSLELLNKLKGYDLLFADPARRGKDNSRTYFLSDCEPDLVSNFKLLQGAASRIIIKGSPILDITQAVREVPDVVEIHIVLVAGECKEVLIVSEEGRKVKDIPVSVVDLEDNPEGCVKFRSRWNCLLSDAGSCPIVEPDVDLTGLYLYDPNAGVHKLNSAAALCRDFEGLRRLAPDCALYVAETLHSDFPGRVFRITGIPYKKALKALKGKRGEVVTRNYPLKADELRKKLGLLSGGELYIVGARISAAKKPVVLECERL